MFIGKRGEHSAFIEMMEKMVSIHSGDGRPVKALVYTKYAEAENSSVRSFMAEYADVCRHRGWWIEGITAEDSHGVRFERLREFESNSAEVSIIVSCRTLSEGVDLAGANVMIPWDPTASIVDNIQRIGRVLRKYREERGGDFCAEQPPSTILIPVWLDSER